MKAVVCLSGGLDSSTLLGALATSKEKPELFALSFYYGQKHEKELSAAYDIAKYYDVPHGVLNLPKVAFKNSAITDPDQTVPEGHYEDENMKATVVPNRNMVMLSIAAAQAISFGFDTVAYAAHAGDHAIYPDCRQSFVIAMRNVLKTAHFTPIHLYTPFLHYRKEDIVRFGREIQVPYHLTWSCYKGGDLHCGKCATCVERLEAFELTHTKDPVSYEVSGAPDK